MKVTTDGCLFGAWAAGEINNEELIINNCLDIGTGTGLLTLMLAQKTSFNIDCIEIDTEASLQAKENADASQWKDRINVINADVKNFQFEKKYELIISNPPFYENELRSPKNSRNLAHHSDELKLELLLEIIKNNLSETGQFFLLLPYKRNNEIRKLFKDHQMHVDKIVFVRQSTGHDYFRIMLKVKLSLQENEETEFDEISIRNYEQLYTKEFIELLKEYYLHL